MMTLPRFLRVVGPSLFIILSFACAVAGQTETATVSGLVTDRTGAAVAGAEVRLQGVERGTVAATTANDAGIYVFPSVQPGRYQISIQKQGFKQVDLLGLIVNVQDHIEQNIRLEVGSIAESVTVNANDMHLNTTDATVSTVIDRQFAENIPMNGRTFQTLIGLAPGVVTTPTNAADSGQFSVNGQRAVSNYWMVDGVSANIGVGAGLGGSPGNGLGGAVGSFSAAGGTNSLVSVDALQEFRIQTSTYAPEFGRTPGGQISIVTRSGTSQFHGTAFDYLRNDALDANDWFADSKNLKKPEERQNDFGGTLGGPIWKDRTFFFFSYEGLRLRLPQTGLTTVPCDSSCTVFGNSRTAAAPGMQPFFNAYPVPNGAEVFTPCTAGQNGCPSSGEQPTGAAQFNASYSNPATLDAYSLRIDHKIKSNLNLFGRYNYSPSEQSQRGNGGALSRVDSTRITTQTGTVGAMWAISATTANDLRFNYSRTNAEAGSSVGSFGGSAPLTSLAFPSPFTIGNGQLQFNPFYLQDGTLLAGPTIENLQRQINVVDGLSVQKGTHSLKFGVDFRRLSPRFEQPAYFQSAFFGSPAAAESGNLTFLNVGSSRATTFLFRDLGIYGQDTWRITPRLTATYGLRWDVDFVPQSIDGPSLNSVTGFNLNNLSNLALAPAGTAPYKTTYDNFAPRIGIAYQLRATQDSQTVLRGGFGVFYDLATSEIGNNLGSDTYPFGALTVCFSSFQLPGCPSNLTFPLDPTTAAPPAITPPTAANGQSLNAFDPNLKLPYTLEWNFAVEQALGGQQMISASYIGARGSRLLQTAGLSGYSGNPNFSAASLVSNAGTSDYDALQLQFQRRLSRGLQVLASYTWAHSIDTGSAGSTVVASNTLVPGAINASRGPSDFDIRNAFSAGVTYDIPTPKSNGVAKAVLHGWSLDNVIQARSAPPVTVNQDMFNGNFVNTANGFFELFRPDLVPGQPLYLHGPQYPGGKALNPGAFTSPPTDPITGLPTRNGDLGRNSLRGFGATQWDFAVHREFPIGEAVKIQFRAEMFNVLNHPNFGQPDNLLSDPLFGRSTEMLGNYLAGDGLGGGALSPLYQVGGPRSVQFALKLIF